MKHLRLLSALIALGLIFPSVTFASGSGGFRNETPDAGAFGKGSAFVGEANTPAAVYYNPAGLNQIDRTALSFGAAVIAPAIKYESSTGAETQARQNKYLVPHFYFVAPMIKNKLTLGLGAGSYWGLGTEWAADSFARYSGTKNELLVSNTMITVAYQVTGPWSLAVSADNTMAKGDENKIVPQDGIHDAGLSFKAKDDAWNWRVATLYKLNDRNQVGLMYRSATHLNFVGKVYLDGLTNAGSVPYAAIFGGSSYETRVTEKLTLPQSVALGYSFKPVDRWTVNADVEWFDWGHFKQEILNFPDETDATRLSVLTGGNPIKHDWTDSISPAVGAEFAATDKLRLRTGYYFHPKLGPQDNFTPVIPDSSAHGITAGFGYDLTTHWTVDVAYDYAHYNERKVHTQEGNLVGANTSGTYNETVNIGMVTATYKF
jgi:long-chain fatty acid transport protein